MEDEYISFYEKYSPLYGPKTVIFMMVGSFYELYDIIDIITGNGKTTCKEAVDTMGIVLTTKKPNPDTTVLFTQSSETGTGTQRSGSIGNTYTVSAGFPESSLHKWAGKLTSLGWTVVVVNQVKDSAGRVFSRKVSSILSPGTHIEGASIDAVYLCGLFIRYITDNPPEFGSCCIDLTTGKTSSYEGITNGRQDEWISNILMHFFQVHSPREIVVWYDGPPMFKPTEDTIRRVLSLQPLTTIHIREHTRTISNLQSEDIFKRVFKPRTLLPTLSWLGLNSFQCPAAISLLQLINFVEDHLPSSIDILQSHKSWKPQEHVFVGNNAFSQLQFIASRDNESVVGIFNRCFTPMGKRAVKERLLIPITDPVILNERYDSIDKIHKLIPATRKSLEASLRSMYDLPRLHRKIQCIYPTAQDIIALYQSYDAIKDILSLEKFHNTSIHTMVQTLLDKLFESFSIEKAQAESSDTRFLNDSFSKTKQYENRLSTFQEEIVDIGKKLQTWAGLKGDALKLDWRDTMCGFRASKSSLQTIKMKYPTYKESCPLKDIEIVLQKSGGWVESSFFKGHFYRVLEARANLNDAFLDELPIACQNFTEATQDFWEPLETWISEIDLNVCFARVAEERGFSRPILNNITESQIDIRGLRHPLIESIQTRSEYVKHDIVLNDKCKGWLVYGMNASGKSSLMKAVGISILLAQSGSFVPATYMSFSPFQSILTRILNQDNLWAGLSSFTVEMSELREILRRADKNSLVLGDELCSGTESISATALVAAGIQSLLNSKSRFLFATHFHGLTNVFKNLPEGLAVWHLRVNYNPVTEKLLYDRTLHPGPGSTLYGLEVARAMDLPKEFLELAATYRRGLVGAVNEDEAPASKWNKEIRRKFCEVCGKNVVRDLEVHHIQERNEAVRGKFKDGTDMNHVRNLVVLCQECHDKEHQKVIKIGPLQQTSHGLERVVNSVKQTASTALSNIKYTPSPSGAGSIVDILDNGGSAEKLIFGGPKFSFDGITEESTDSKESNDSKDNQEDSVTQYLRDHPAMPLKQISFFLKQKGISLTTARLATIRKKL